MSVDTTGSRALRPCGCPQGTSVACPAHPPGPGVFDVMQVTGWRPTDPQPSTVKLSEADVEAIARLAPEQIREAIAADAVSGIDACGFSPDLSIYVDVGHIAAVRAALEARKAAS